LIVGIVMQEYPSLSIMACIDVGVLQCFERGDNLTTQLNTRITRIMSFAITSTEATHLREGSSSRRLWPPASRVASSEFVYSSAWSRIDVVTERDLTVVDLCK